MEGWTTLEPISFHKVAGDHQYAKDDNYMQAVLELWEKELNGVFVQTRPFLYHADDKETPLFGQVVCRRKDRVTRPVPGILLFHTAAGPKDIFMFYKAAMLIQQFDCVVFICDIMSDETGWGWDSVRTRYTETRESLLRNDARLLQARVLAACKALCANDGDFLVDPQRLAAMGWCLGGLPICELARLQSSILSSLDFCLRSMVTFHGVFRRGETSKADDEVITPSSEVTNSELLICNGVQDPFVSSEDLTVAKQLFRQHGFQVEILNLKGAKHGFSNPAQTFNENPSFGYDEKAATEAWDTAIQLLARTLSFT